MLHNFHERISIIFISVGFTFLVQMTFICTCADCICELAYRHAVIAHTVYCLNPIPVVKMSNLTLYIQFPCNIHTYVHLDHW